MIRPLLMTVPVSCIGDSPARAAWPSAAAPKTSAPVAFSNIRLRLVRPDCSSARLCWLIATVLHDSK